MVSRRIALAVLLFVVGCHRAEAQELVTTSAIAGRVRDATQAVLPGAAVTAVNSATNLQRSTKTGPEGRFTIPALPPGVYAVVVESTGFATQVTENVELALGSTVEIDVTLMVAGLVERISVAATALIDSQRTAVGAVVSQQQIERLPINGRDFLSFSLLTPGVATDRTPQQGASATSGLTFAGQRARANNILVDGLDNNDPIVGGVRAIFSQEAIREFQVLTHSYSAEFGKASGGVVNIITKSGSNTASGNVFFYLRDESLNAKEQFEKFDPAGNPIDRSKAPYRQKQFGGILSGPIKKDRAFYLLSFERLDIGASNFVTIDDRTPVVVFGRPAGTAADILRGAGFPIETGHVPYGIRSSQLLARTDQHLRNNQNLTMRFTWANGLNENIEPWGGLVARSRGALRDSRDTMVAGSYLAVPSSTLVNEIRFQVAKRRQLVQALDPVCNGICDREDEGGPTLEVTGVASVGRQRFTPTRRETVLYQVIDTAGFYRGRHHFKTGLDFSYHDSRRGTLPLHFGGRYIFAPLPAIPGVLPAPVSSIQALSLGLPAAYVQGFGNSAAAHPSRELSLFAEESWRTTDTLTVKLGIRYQKQFWDDEQYSVPGLSTYTFPSDNNNVAPRLSASWTPTGAKRKAAIHASYGIFYDNQLTGLVGITDIVDGSADGVRTVALRFPQSVAAWQAPGRRLPEAAVGVFPSVVIAIDPTLKTPYAHHASAGIDYELPGQVVLAANLVHARGFNQLGAIDFNPFVPALGPGRRPEDIDGRAGTSASVLQYTSFGQTWYRGLTSSLSKRLSRGIQFVASYTLSKAEDNSTDFQTSFLPQDNGWGRDPANREGLPLGFDPRAERGPSLQDQRHRFAVSGSSMLPADVQLAAIVTVGSGRPYSVLAGVDLNGDGDGGAFPSDRARRDPSDSASSLGRNSATLPAHATVDLRVGRRFRLAGRVDVEGIVELFNVFNRTNFTEVNNVFGQAAYPAAPAPGFGQFQQAAPPRQAQIAARIGF